jgi:taurine dioxygenase
MQETKVNCKLITPSIGTEINNLDLTNLTFDREEEMRKCLIRRKVIVFRNQSLSPLELLNFMKIFGEPYAEDLQPQDGNPPEVGVIKIKPNERQTINFWHMDYSFTKKPSPILALYAKHIPPCGGDTLFTNLEAAYDGLDAGLKIKINTLMTNHKLNVETQNAKNRWTKEELERMDFDPPIQHPLVCTNPDNQKKYLFVNVPIFCESIVGMKNPEGDRLLSSLYLHAQRPEYSFRLRWSEKTLVVWENNHCLHYPVSDYFPNERKLLRVAIKGTLKPKH